MDTPHLNRQTLIEDARKAVLDALDAFAAASGMPNQTNGATDADLPELFRGIDAQVDRWIVRTGHLIPDQVPNLNDLFKHVGKHVMLLDASWVKPSQNNKVVSTCEFCGKEQVNGCSFGRIQTGLCPSYICAVAETVAPYVKPKTV